MLREPSNDPVLDRLKHGCEVISREVCDGRIDDVYFEEVETDDEENEGDGEGMVSYELLIFSQWPFYRVFREETTNTKDKEDQVEQC